jgi:primosomal protein N'
MSISAIGPIPSIISKTRGNYRHHLMLQASSKVTLNRLLKKITAATVLWKETKKVKWFFDLDPIDYN